MCRKSRIGGKKPRRVIPHSKGGEPRRRELCNGEEGPGCTRSGANKLKPSQDMP